MSSSRSPNVEKNSPDNQCGDPSHYIPTGWEPAPHDPTAVVLRCEQCGFLDTVPDRAEAHGRADDHGAEYGHQVGRTPVKQTGHERPEIGERATIYYESARSGNELSRTGEVVGYSEGRDTARIKIETDESQTIRAYDDLHTDVGHEVQTVGKQTVTLGRLVAVEYHHNDEPEPVSDHRGHDSEAYRRSGTVGGDDCPLCGTDIADLAAHLPDCPERDESDVDRGNGPVTDGGRPAVQLDELGRAQCPHCGREGPADPGYQLCIECSRWFVVEDAVIMTDGGREREREGQRTLEDARWDPQQQTLEDVGEDDEDIQCDGGTRQLVDPLGWPPHHNHDPLDWPPRGDSG